MNMPQVKHPPIRRAPEAAGGSSSSAYIARAASSLERVALAVDLREAGLQVGLALGVALGRGALGAQARARFTSSTETNPE